MNQRIFSKICVNQFLGKCPSCEIDRDPNHHPNNLDCPRYIEMTVWTVDTSERILNADMVFKNGDGKVIGS